MTDLLPCPFCGGKAAIQEDDMHKFCVSCTTTDCFCELGAGCDADGNADHIFSARADAAEAWNRRA